MRAATVQHACSPARAQARLVADNTLLEKPVKLLGARVPRADAGDVTVAYDAVDAVEAGEHATVQLGAGVVVQVLRQLVKFANV